MSTILSQTSHLSPGRLTSRSCPKHVSSCLVSAAGRAVVEHSGTRIYCRPLASLHCPQTEKGGRRRERERGGEGGREGVKEGYHPSNINPLTHSKT